MKNFLRVALASCLLWGASATVPVMVQPARATVVLKVDFDKAVEQSSAVVRGSIVAKEGKVFTDAEGNSRALTFYTLKVAHVYVGEIEGKTITLLNPGGAEANGIRYEIPAGFPDHEVGEDLIVMLEPAGDNYVITGLHQGKYHVMTSDETGITYVTRQHSSAQLIDEATKKPTSSMTQQQLFRLNEFEEKLESAAAKAEKSFAKASDEKSGDDASAAEEATE